MSAEKGAKNCRKESEPQPNKPAETSDCSPSSAFIYENKNIEEKYNIDISAALELYLHLNEIDRMLVLERMKSLLKNKK